jgi:hypothetical protein
MDPRWSRQTNLKDIPHPAKPQWQGLTLEDIDDIGVSKDWIAGARWAEAKLKDKNTSDDARMKSGWQGMTERDVKTIIENAPSAGWAVRMTESTLKEKNGV